MSELSFGEVGEILHLLQEVECSKVDLEWRTDFEDNIFYSKGRLAASNAELVSLELCPEYDRHPASPGETHALLKVALPT